MGVSAVPDSLRSASSLPRIAYADAFTLPTGLSATPEGWARAMFGDTPDFAARLIWRGFLGLRLSQGAAPDTVAGWRIAGRGRDWIRLEADSWFLNGNLVVRADGAGVSLGTFLHYRQALGRVVWPPLSALHRRLAPGLLRDAAAKLRLSGRGATPPV
ncbi:hypothetical protein GCM10028793_53960 [Nocardiopsis oceani]